MKTRFRRGLFGMAALFVALFAVRLAYGFVNYPPGATLDSEPAIPNFDLGFKNIGSRIEVYKDKGSGVAYQVDQKYEKVADISSRTRDFDGDEGKLRACIREKHAVVQFEQLVGLTGSRVLHLGIGVHPDHFDRTWWLRCETSDA